MKYFFRCLLFCLGVVLMSCSTQDRIQILDSPDGESPIFSDPYQPPYYLNGGEAGLQSDLYDILSKNPSLKKNGIQGRAVFCILISEDCVINPDSVRLIRNVSLPKEYVVAAIEAIIGLGRFEPAKMNDIPQQSKLNLPIIFPIPLERIKKNK